MVKVRVVPIPDQAVLTDTAASRSGAIIDGENTDEDTREGTPQGWASAALLEVADLIRGVSYERGEATTYPDPGRVALLRANNIAGELIFRELQYVPRHRVATDQMLRVGDSVVAMSSGSKAVVGKAATLSAPWSGTFGAFCGVIRPSEHIDWRFIGLFLQTESYRRAISAASAGVNINNLKRQHFAELPVPIPPLVEQRRIAEAAELLLERVDVARARLDRAEAVVKRFRQAVLAAACSGKLTEDWRTANVDAENGRTLLARLASKNDVPRRGRKVPSHAVDASQSEYETMALPSSWARSPCVSLCQHSRSLTYGVIKLGPPVDDGVPTLRSSDVRHLFIDERHVKRIARTIADEYRRTYLEGGEVVVTVRGSLGGVAVVPEHMKGYNVSREVAVVPIGPELNTGFFALAIGSEASQKWLMETAKGVTYTGINIEDLKRLPLPVPPLAEQQEIVRRVEALFGLADKLEGRIRAARTRVDALPQAILARAFTGRLVPTEAELARREGRTYEPASALLERIKTERAKPAQNTNGRRRKRL